jgi:oligopeptide/dipeptide ABC transporter ATP-binding protein
MLLEVTDLRKYFPLAGGRAVKAVDGVSFTVPKGSTFGLVGESGCGKSTVARLLLKLYTATGGRMMLGGEDVTGIRGKKLKEFRRRVQMVFQDPYASLNPRMTVGRTLSDPLRIHGFTAVAAKERVAELLAMVGLEDSHARRYPHEFSGGQRQRIGIARALALNPDLILLDEAVSALDVSIQAQVLNLLVDLQRQLGLTYVFISHDLSVVDYMCDRIAVMYLGHIVESGTREQIFSESLHPYTRALLASIPDNKELEIILKGELPSPADPPPGCPFSTRCPMAVERCRQDLPSLELVSSGHLAACHLL